MRTIIFMAYPEKRYVTEEEVRSWALDDIVNEEISEDITEEDAKSGDLQRLVDALNDYGSVTLVIEDTYYS